MNIPLGQWSGSDATNVLRELIKAQHEENAKQANLMLRLTWSIVVLTVVMLIGLGVQIWLAIDPPNKSGANVANAASTTIGAEPQQSIDKQ